MILVISDAFDTHADAVERFLKLKSSPYFRLNLDKESLRRSFITFSQEEWSIRQNDVVISSRDIYCVWPRRLTVYQDLEEQFNTQESSVRLWRAEWNRCLYGFYASIRSAFWMNEISKAALIDNKIYQMKAAKRNGFNIPDSIYSNNIDDLLSFADRHKSVALKFLSQDMYKMPDGSFGGLYVNKISRKEIIDFGGAEQNPICLQQYIEKDYEVRYTFVDGEHFPCKIESQANERTRVDWRRYNIPDTPHSSFVPPQEIIQKISVFMSEIGLAYGAFDFIVDNLGKWWYLEVNSGGQWLWIEDLIQVPISERIANCLELHNGKV